jgi:putative flippase GtrA
VPVSSQFVRFLLAGIAAATLNVVARVALDLVVPFEAAVAFSYGIGMSAAFGFNRWMVFTHAKTRWHVQYGRFAMINAIAFAQVWLVSVGLDRFVFPAIGLTWHAATIAHVIGVSCPLLTSYFGHRHYSFR